MKVDERPGDPPMSPPHHSGRTILPLRQLVRSAIDENGDFEHEA
jgi:hypothetical protein